MSYRNTVKCSYGKAAILDHRGQSNFAELQADVDRHGSQCAVRLRPALPRRRGAVAAAAERAPALTRWHRPAAIGHLLSKDFAGSGADLFRIACENDLEGIVSKRLDKPYRSGCSRDWLKTKCATTGDFVIIGYQPGLGRRAGAAGEHQDRDFDGKRLRDAGAVGTGFSKAVATALRERLDGI